MHAHTHIHIPQSIFILIWITTFHNVNPHKSVFVKCHSEVCSSVISFILQESSDTSYLDCVNEYPDIYCIIYYINLISHKSVSSSKNKKHIRHVACSARRLTQQVLRGQRVPLQSRDGVLLICALEGLWTQHMLLTLRAWAQVRGQSHYYSIICIPQKYIGLYIYIYIYIYGI